MKNHVWRPLFAVVGIIISVVIFRFIYVPKDFGIHERGYMYGWYREGNIDEWKAVQVKYQGKEYCKDCHSDKHEKNMKSPHSLIQCENCHGPALEHPSEPPKLAIDKAREQCLRCHMKLPYPTSGRSSIRGIDPAKHNPDIECVSCHNPHSPMEGLK